MCIHQRYCVAYFLRADLSDPSTIFYSGGALIKDMPKTPENTRPLINQCQCNTYTISYTQMSYPIHPPCCTDAAFSKI